MALFEELRVGYDPEHLRTFTVSTEVVAASTSRTLDDLPTMPVGEIPTLSGDQLAVLKQDPDERLRAAKTLCGWPDGAIALKYGD